MKGQTGRYAWVCIAGLLVAATVVGGQTKKKRKMYVWERAEKAYQTARTLYYAGEYKLSAKAFETFIRKFPTNENVPVAYCQMATAKMSSGDSTGGLKAIEEVIKRFRDSKAAYYALGYKMSRVFGVGDYDQFLKMYQEVTTKTGQAPLSMGQRYIAWGSGASYGYHANIWWPGHYRSGFYIKVISSWRESWAKNYLLKAANTTERAQKALRIVSPTLQEHGQQLPSDWKYAHVELLRRTGSPKDEKAAEKKAKAIRKQFEEYAGGFVKGDPDAMMFWVYQAEQDQADGKDAAAEKAYQHLIDTWGGFYSLGLRIPTRLSHLYAAGRHEDWFKLARWFLEKYPENGWRTYAANSTGMHRYPHTEWRYRDSVLARWVGLAAKDTKRIPATLKLLEEDAETYKFNPRRMRTSLARRISLLLTLKKVDEAVGLAKVLMGNDYWSAELFGYVQGLAKQDKAFEPLVAAARRKWVIPVADPKNKPAALLKALRGFMKDDTANARRRMEEIAEEMYQDYRDDASTIEAIKTLVGHYVQKVLYDQRDKWAQRMIGAYRHHPDTQRVMEQQIGAKHGEKEYKELAPLTAAAIARFGGAGAYQTWFDYRIECYDAMKDKAGRIKFARAQLSKRARSGELEAMALLGTYEEKDREKHREMGAYWERQAKKFAGHHQGIFCLRRAFHAYYTSVRYRYNPPEICFPEAADVARRLREQRIYPELAWQMSFEDINMISQQGVLKNDATSGIAALVALETRLRDKEHDFSLRGRLDTANLGWVLGSASLSGRAKEAISQLQTRMCKTEGDHRNFAIMMGVMYEREGKYLPAFKYYTTVVDSSPWPITQYPWHAHAMSCLRSADSASTTPAKAFKYIAGQKQYLRRVQTAQGLVPQLLLEMGQYKGGEYAKTYFRMLSRYAASKARGQMEALRRQ